MFQAISKFMPFANTVLPHSSLESDWIVQFIASQPSPSLLSRVTSPIINLTSGAVNQVNGLMSGTANQISNLMTGTTYQMNWLAQSALSWAANTPVGKFAQFSVNQTRNVMNVTGHVANVVGFTWDHKEILLGIGAYWVGLKAWEKFKEIARERPAQPPAPARRRDTADGIDPAMLPYLMNAMQGGRNDGNWGRPAPAPAAAATSAPANNNITLQFNFADPKMAPPIVRDLSSSSVNGALSGKRFEAGPRTITMPLSLNHEGRAQASDAIR